MIVQTISGLYQVPPITGSYYQISKSYICGGTLINSFTVLTAAHCVETEFSHDVGFSSYTVNVKNPFDASQYSVYVGAFDVSFLSYGGVPAFPTVKMAVRKVIRVSLIKNF